MWALSIKMGRIEFDISLKRESVEPVQDKPTQDAESTLYGPKTDAIGYVTETRYRASQHVKKSV